MSNVFKGKNFMKRNILKYIKSGAALLFIAVLATQSTKAQDIDTGTFSISGQWQFNAPINNNYSDKASGWGMNIDGLYNLSSNLAAGAFISWHTNNTYVPRTTYNDGTSAVNMDMQRSLFQLPFGVAGRYKFPLSNGNIVPFAGVKLGANYTKEHTYSNIFGWTDDQWGFYASPEIGVTVFPLPTRSVGFVVSGYYNYSTNKAKDYDINGLNNIGFRVGVVFQAQ